MNNTHTISKQDAEIYAKQDAETILAAARYGKQALMTEPEGARLILVDGSMYSPSWRALQGGGFVYDLTDDTEQGWETIDLYAEVLDELTLDADLGDCHLYWDEGCLFVSNPEPEED